MLVRLGIRAFSLYKVTIKYLCRILTRIIETGKIFFKILRGVRRFEKQKYKILDEKFGKVPGLVLLEKITAINKSFHNSMCIKIHDV